MTKEILTILESFAQTHEEELRSQVASLLQPMENRVLDWLFDQYRDPNKRRWYDPYHILYSTRFATELVENEGAIRSIVPAIILHDVGYFAIEDKTQWSHPNVRIIHMQEGGPIAAKVLIEMGYKPDEIQEILGMIAVHDNPYINLPIKGETRLALRDCDRIWVMHILSFYKDIASKSGRLENPQGFLLDRLVQFFGWEHDFKDKEFDVSIDVIKINAPRIEPPFYGYTKRKITKQFSRRMQELENPGLLSGLDALRNLVEERIISE